MPWDGSGEIQLPHWPCARVRMLKRVRAMWRRLDKRVVMYGRDPMRIFGGCISACISVNVNGWDKATEDKNEVEKRCIRQGQRLARLFGWESMHW